MLLLSSTDQMCEVMRHAIESGDKVLHELCLENTEFIVNEVCILSLSSIYTLYCFSIAIVCAMITCHLHGEA